MMNDTALKSSTLIRIKLMMRQLMPHHMAQSMDEVSMVQVVEPILIRVMGVGLTVEVMGRRVLNPILVMSILRNRSRHM